MPTVYFDDDPQPSRFVEFDNFVEFDDDEDTPWWKRTWGSLWQGLENVGQTGLSIATLPALLAERVTGRPGIGTQAQQEYGAGMSSLRSALGAEEELKGEGALGWLAKTGVESLPWMALPAGGLASKGASWATRGMAEGALFGGAEAAGALGRGESLGEAATTGLTTGVGVLGLSGLGAAFKKAFAKHKAAGRSDQEAARAAKEEVEAWWMDQQRQGARQFVPDAEPVAAAAPAPTPDLFGTAAVKAVGGTAPGKRTTPFEVQATRHIDTSQQDAENLKALLADLEGSRAGTYLQDYELNASGHNAARFQQAYERAKAEGLGDAAAAKKAKGEVEAFVEEFHAGPEGRPETFSMAVSQEQQKALRQQVDSLKTNLLKLRQTMREQGDAVSAERATQIYNDDMKLLKQKVDEFAAVGTASARTLRDRQTALSDAYALIARITRNTEDIRAAKQRAPIYTEAAQLFKKALSEEGLTDAERSRLIQDAVDAVRLNFFAPTSFVLDVGSDAMIGARELAGAIGSDIGTSIKLGKPTPEARAAWRASAKRGLADPVFNRIAGKPAPKLPSAVTDEIGTTAMGGEPILSGGFGGLTGTFTERKTLPSKILDYGVGSPMYAKGAVDSKAKEMGAWYVLGREARRVAREQGITNPEELTRFVDDFIQNPPEDAVKLAVEMANRAGFNQELSSLEQRVSGSTLYKLFGDTFPRWGFQFTRAAADFVDAPTWKKIATGKATAEEVGSTLAKNLAGVGGLAFVSDTLYDRVDWNSMEYVKENGDRVRLAGRSPVPEALALVALAKGDMTKFSSSLQYTSFPFIKTIGTTDTGLLGGAYQQLTESVKRKAFDPKGLMREFTDIVNRLVPGQALLSTLASIESGIVEEGGPVQHEGLGAKLPLVQNLTPETIQRTTGEPRQPEQYVDLGIPLPGLSEETPIPQIGGVAIPGVVRKLDPLERIFSLEGLYQSEKLGGPDPFRNVNTMVYRGPRSPIAGMKPSEFPPEMDREWQVELGKARQEVFGPYLSDPDYFKRGTQEWASRIIAQLDSRAASIARARLRQRYPNVRTNE